MKIRLYFFALMTTLMCFAANTHTTAATSLSKEQVETRVAEINQRVDQIQAMDLKHLDKVQRTNLRHELKGMKSELRAMGPVAIVLSYGRAYRDHSVGDPVYLNSHLFLFARRDSHVVG